MHADADKTVGIGTPADDKTHKIDVPPPAVPPGPGPGSVIGNFTIIRLLGRGGMGEVHLARQATLERDVALKILPFQLTSQPEFVKRFLNEVRMAAKLEHPNIVTAYEAGESGGIYYLAMAYVKGEPLDRHLRESGAMNETRALEVTRDIARALSYASEEHGMLHRDVKPANIMLTPDGTAKLMDMGLSKLCESTEHLTMSGAVVGTPNYMSPEQATASRKLDARSDMYSLGATLYHMVTGKAPFAGSTLLETLKKQATEALPNPRTLNPRVSEPCARVMATMLAKQPERRYATWRELIDDINAVLAGHNPAAPTPPAGESVVEALPAPVSERPAQRDRTADRSSRITLAALIAALALVGGLYVHQRLHRASTESPPSATTARRVATPRPHAAPADAPAATLPNYYALVIGIGDYTPHQGEGWAPLTTARADAEAVGAILESNYACRVTRLLDRAATRAAIMAQLDELVSLGTNDAAIIYYAGHGYYDKRLGEGYWIPADARKYEGKRPAQEEWLWNSTITKILGASAARHILIIADSCYAGSLLRGEESRDMTGGLDWYRRAIRKPSRYVIASGDLEPVLDSGIHHSVFAQEVLNYLQNGDKDVFSASDLAMITRRQVGSLTGQMVQMGPLLTAGHGGGEFVFVRDRGREELGLPPARLVADKRSQRGGPAAAPPAAAGPPNELLSDVLALNRSGATNAAQRLLGRLTQGNGGDWLASAVAGYLNQRRQTEQHEALNALMKTLEARAKENASTNAPLAGTARPRVIACIGPEPAEGARGGAGRAMLVRIGLQAALQRIGGVQVVEREALQQILEEMGVGTSDLSAPGARLMLGRILPAGLLLLGDIVGDGQTDTVMLRLVDTETTRILGSFTAEQTPRKDLGALCTDLAMQVLACAVRAQPLDARVSSAEGTRLRAEVGASHGLKRETKLAIMLREFEDAGHPRSFRERRVGSATPASVGDVASDLVADWTEAVTPDQSRNLWVREIPQ